MELPEIVLRPVAESDAEILLRWAPDKLEGYRFLCRQEEVCRMIREWNAGQSGGKTFVIRLIEAGGSAVGLLSLYGDGVMSVGVSVAADKRRCGYAKAAVCAAKEIARGCGCTLLTGQNRVENAASIALCEGCGFACVGRTVNRKGHEVFLWEMPLG